MTPTSTPKPAATGAATSSGDDPVARTVVEEPNDDDKALAGNIVLREYEDRLSAATAQADDELIRDVQDEYHAARMTRLKANRRREKRAEKRANEEGGDGQ